MQFGPYALAGWRVESEMELPELHPWMADCGEGKALTIAFETGKAVEGPKGLQVGEDGSAVLRIEGVAMFEIAAAGDRVGIAAVEGADPILARGYLYGSVLAGLCYKRGLFPLHGAAVLMEEDAVLLSGPSGAGKSTLATALVRRGHALLSDDVCPVEFRAGEAWLWPVLARVKLLEDAIAALGLEKATTYSRSARGLKGNFRLAALAQGIRVVRPVRVKAIWALEEPGGEVIACRRLALREAFAALEARVHRAKMGRLLGRGAWILRQTCLAAETIPVYRLERPRALERLAETAELIENTCEWCDKPAAESRLVMK